MLPRMSRQEPVPGFRLSAAAAGLKKDQLDVGLIVAERPAAAAAVCTRNRLKAAPVVLTEQRVRSGRLQAILVNSGNANASTGGAGMAAAQDTTTAVAQRLGVQPELVVPASTGVIGVPLDTHRIIASIDRLVDGLAPQGIEDFAQSILTTDRNPKIARRGVHSPDGGATVLAIAKGAGMIHPNMATTLAFVLTDAPCPPDVLRQALLQATDLTFNRISVDGDTSTNDCIVALASGESRDRSLTGARDRAAFVDALTEVLDEVAVMIVADGEGAEHAVRIVVEQAPSERAALSVARTIATSNLVKTALYGQDPNWGRILAAAGRSSIEFEPERATVLIGDVCVYEAGKTMSQQSEIAACAVMKRPTYAITVRLAAGTGQAWYWTCDLGHEYVRINADYRT